MTEPMRFIRPSVQERQRSQRANEPLEPSISWNAFLLASVAVSSVAAAPVIASRLFKRGKDFIQLKLNEHRSPQSESSAPVYRSKL